MHAIYRVLSAQRVQNALQVLRQDALTSMHDRQLQRFSEPIPLPLKVSIPSYQQLLASTSKLQAVVCSAYAESDGETPDGRAYFMPPD